METRLRAVECLSCGYRRSVREAERHSGLGECPRCAYVGWASSAELSETTRRLVRERPVEHRHLRLVEG
jgi:hypothetical protein